MTHRMHDKHEHEHRPGCGHAEIRHEDHVDYLHDGHLHRTHDGHTDEHVLALAGMNVEHDHSCDSHDRGHVHGEACGHERIPHDDHADFLVATHVHHVHEGHCDLHGSVQRG